jgi:hypothetical protein
MVDYFIVLRRFINVKLHNFEYVRIIVNDESVRMKESQLGLPAGDRTVYLLMQMINVTFVLLD